MKHIVYLTKPANHFLKETAGFCWEDMQNVLYGYTFLFDPFILATAGSIPEMRALQRIRSWDAIDLCICGMRQQLVTQDMEGLLVDGAKLLLQKGKGVVLTQPSHRFYRELPTLRNTRYVRDICSLCEEWRIDVPVCKHSQNYPQKLMFQAVTGPGTVFSTVGEWPALMVDGKLALFAVDPLRAFARWNRGNVIWKHANLWVFLARQLLGAPAVDPGEIDRQIDLRRDFHAFGYALVMLRELAELEKRSLDRFMKAACEKVVAAADAFVRRQYPAAQAALGSAFQDLYRGRCAITRMDIHLADSLHGSTVYPDAGFAEFEWPEELSRYMQMFFHLIETRNYRVNLDWDGRSMKNLADRCPGLTARMRQLVEAGSLEFINGGYSQQYPHYVSPQANIENIRQGRRVFERVLGQAPVTYGGQECCMNPQMPNLLTKLGYRQALHRIQNFGHVPLVKEAAIRWRGKDGSAIVAVPGNPTATERLGCLFYLLLAYKIHQSLRAGLRDPVLTNLQDIGMVAFREEVCRIAYYAPIFGRHTTLSACLKACHGRLPVKSFAYYDYLYGYFYRDSRWRGDENDGFAKAFALEQAIANARLLNGLAAFHGKARLRDFWPQWDLLFALHAHDSVLAGNLYMGAFFGGGGPLDDDMTNAVMSHRNYDPIMARVQTGMARDLHAVLGAPGGRWAAFNTLGFPRHAVLKTAEGYARVALPAWGGAFTSPLSDGQVRVTSGILENERLNIRFDPESGCIGEIRDKSTGRVAVARANEFVYGATSTMRMTERRIVERDASRSEVMTSGTVWDHGEKVAFYETYVALADDSRVVDIRTRLRPLIALPPNPCEKAFRLSVQIAGPKPEIVTSYLNIFETLREPAVAKQFQRFKPQPYLIFLRPTDTRLHMFSSPNYVRLNAGGHTVDLFNNGPQWYYAKEGQILQHLVGSNDHCFDFRYALAVGQTKKHPLLAALDWQTPPLACQVKNRIPPSLFATELPNVLLFGCAYLGQRTFLIRAMEIAGRRARGIIASGYRLQHVEETDYLGNRLRSLKARPAHFACDMPAWGIAEYHVRLNTSPNHEHCGVSM